MSSSQHVISALIFLTGVALTVWGVVEVFGRGWGLIFAGVVLAVVGIAGGRLEE